MMSYDARHPYHATTDNHDLVLLVWRKRSMAQFSAEPTYIYKVSAYMPLDYSHQQTF